MSSDPTTASILIHPEDGSGPEPLGRVRQSAPTTGRRLAEFKYEKSWLGNPDAFAIDPENLPLATSVYASIKHGGMIGVLRDAAPDRWGRRLLSLFHNRPVTELEYLLMSSDDRPGALEFVRQGYAKPPRSSVCFEDLEAIADLFHRFDEGLPLNQPEERLVKAGVSLGGARPKAALQLEGDRRVQYGAKSWIAKFPRRDDTFDVCAAEHASMQFASRCGMNVAETKLEKIGGRSVLLVKRFDRVVAPAGEGRLAYISAGALLDEDETSLLGSYPMIADKIRLHSAMAAADLEELFRRMCFNCMIGNRDDHLRNHAMIVFGGKWRLSPAFDVLPAPALEAQQAISVGRFGTLPSRENCLSQVGRFLLAPQQAAEIYDKVAEHVSGWRDAFMEFGVPEEDIRKLAPAFGESALDAPLSIR